MIKKSKQNYQNYQKWVRAGLLVSGFDGDTLANQFLEYTVKNNISLDYLKSNWSAVVPIQYKKGKERINFDCVLKVVPSGLGTEWKIASVRSAEKSFSNCATEIVDFCKYDSDSIYIGPNSHLVDFIELGRLFSKKTLSEEHLLEGDPSLDCFWEWYLETNKVGFEKIKGIYFELYLDNYVVIVRELMNESVPSGWLIDSLYFENN